MPAIVNLERKVLRVSGPDAERFLKGLVTGKIPPYQAHQPTIGYFNALLTSQGKYVCDFFIVGSAEGFYIDVHQKFSEVLLQKLKLYKLRAQVMIEELSLQWQVVMVWGEEDVSLSSALWWRDSRHPALGRRGLVRNEDLENILTLFKKGTWKDYNILRIQLAVPEGNLDLQPERSIILEYNYEEMGALDWEKGCYMGQELMSRTKFRGVVRKGIFCLQARESEACLREGVSIYSRPLSAGPEQELQEAVGFLCSSQGNLALALLKKDTVQKVRQQQETLYYYNPRTQEQGLLDLCSPHKDENKEIY